MRCAIQVLCLLLGAFDARAEVVRIDELEILETGPMTRPSLALDPVEAVLVRGSSPGPGQQMLRAGDDGWFVDDALTGNYARARIAVAEDGVWLLEAMAYAGVYVNGELRMGNVYGHKDEWEAWEPRFDFVRIPVRLRAGENELIFFGVRWGRMRAALHPAPATAALNDRDPTLPDLVVDRPMQGWGALPVVNPTSGSLGDLRLRARVGDEFAVETRLPSLPPLGIRKVGFRIEAEAPSAEGTRTLTLELLQGKTILDTRAFDLEVKRPGDNRRVTFVSGIDGSVQYYGLLPATGPPGPKALVLSLHGAGVEAINQSGSYAALPWAHIVAPTNRRPFGFDWENWGRLDALEVLDLAESELQVDGDRVYLTGHSMGGHGTWHLATLHPDRFAAAGPSAGWITYWSYRRDLPADPTSPLKELLGRASLTSQTLAKAPNLAPVGLYVLHGADDDNVPPAQSRLMLDELAGFHRDYRYHEEPAAGHWWDHSDEPGADCVAWAPMFDFFARHRRPSREEIRTISFLTPSPGTSASNHWATIHRQGRVFEMSRVELSLDPWRHRIDGTTANVEVLGLSLGHLETDSVRVNLDGQEGTFAVGPSGQLWLERGRTWRARGEPDPRFKGAHRNGGFRDAYTNRPIFVVGTLGSGEETAWAWSRARYDAEYLWYQGNASIDVVADTDFDPAIEPDRNVILYGNAETHGDWSALSDGVLEVRRSGVTLGGVRTGGDALGVLAIRPRPGSDTASVGYVSGTGLPGLRLTERRPVLQGGFAYPDLTVLEDRGDGTVVRTAGFFGADWSVDRGEFVTAGDPADTGAIDAH